VAPLVTKTGRLKSRLEQYRQARAIHGGVMKLCAASLAVRLSRLPIPSKRLRVRVYSAIYGKKYPPLDEAELERPLWEYRSFNALFTRGVNPELRPISTAQDQLVCPCDGMVQDLGRIRDGKILTVKGIEYTVDSLLAGEDPECFRDGHYAIYFLSPCDCHRVFSPHRGRLDRVLHVPGYRLLVHPPFQRQEFPVFAMNERMILRLSTSLGPCALVLVAGWGVGNITLPRARHFRPTRRQLSQCTFAPPLRIERAEWLATFELGSTAILLTGPMGGVTANVAVGEKVKYGQPAFTAQAAAPQSAFEPDTNATAHG
jgi:phosphatidylserine decarboxylase